MSERPPSDVFGTFLETMQKSSAVQKRRPGGDWLLGRLRESKSQSIPDLLASGELSFADFSAMLGTMQEAGLVKLEGAPGKEIVSLTPAGAQVAGALS